MRPSALHSPARRHPRSCFAGAAHAATTDEIPLLPCASCVGFDLQPDPPRPSDRVNPGRGLNPPPGLNQSPALKGETAGQ